MGGAIIETIREESVSITTQIVQDSDHIFGLSSLAADGSRIVACLKYFDHII